MKKILKHIFTDICTGTDVMLMSTALDVSVKICPVINF